MLSGRKKPTEYYGLPVPQVQEAKDARPSNGTTWRGREIVMCLIAVMCLIGCDTDETVEDFCPETEFTSRSNYIDSIYTGTWQWHFPRPSEADARVFPSCLLFGGVFATNKQQPPRFQ